MCFMFFFIMNNIHIWNSVKMYRSWNRIHIKWEAKNGKLEFPWHDPFNLAFYHILETKHLTHSVYGFVLLKCNKYTVRRTLYWWQSKNIMFMERKTSSCIVTERTDPWEIWPMVANSVMGDPVRHINAFGNNQWRRQIAFLCTITWCCSWHSPIHM
jgi:hypothetical protein